MEAITQPHREMRPFADLVVLQSDAGRKLKQKEYLAEAVLPVVDQGAALIGGYTDDESLRYRGPLPVVVFGDHTRNFKLIDFPFAVGADGVKLLAPKDGIDVSYLYYMLLAVELPNRGYSRHLQFLKKTELPLVPLPEQRRIVAAIETELGRLDAAVASLHAAKAKLKRYKQAVLNEYVYVDDAEELNLEEAVERVQIGPFGSQLHKADYITGGIPLINPQHIVDMRIEPDDSLTLSQGKFAELPNYHLREGDVILGRRGEMGRCAVITEVEDGWFCGTGSLFIRPGAKVDSKFLAYFLSSPSSVSYLEGSSIGTTMSNLNKAILLGMPIRLPALKEQRRLVKLIEQTVEKSSLMDATVDAQLQQASRLRQSVLKRAFEGRLV